MSYSLVTVWCVFVFSFAIPRATPASLEPGAELDAIKAHVLKKIYSTSVCTPPSGKDLDDLTTETKLKNSAVLVSTQLKDIKDTILSVYHDLIPLDLTESNKIYIIVVSEVLFPTGCASAVPSLQTDIPILQTKILGKAETMLGPEKWANRKYHAACYTLHVLNELKKDYKDDIPFVGSEITKVISDSVSAIHFGSDIAGIGTKEIFPPVELVSDAFDIGRRNKRVVKYLGVFPNVDDAKRAHLACLVMKRSYRRFNPQLPPEPRQKLEDHIIANHQFGNDCSAPSSGDLDKMADDLIKSGGLLEGFAKWTVLTTISSFFEQVKLTKYEKEFTRVAIDRAALPPPKCSVKSSSLGVDNNALIAAANAQIENMCAVKGCGQKRFGLKCFLQKYIEDAQASLANAVESLPAGSREEIKHAIAEIDEASTARAASDSSATTTTTAAPVKKGVPLAHVVKLFNVVKEKPKTKEWISDNAGRNAVVVCTIDALLTERKAKADGTSALPLYAVVLIVLGVVILIILIAIAIFYYMKRRR